MEDKANAGSAASEATETVSSPGKKVAKSKGKSQKGGTAHPPTSEMVHAAMSALKDRKGSSLQAIKKYIAATYKVDGEKFAPFIKRYLKAAVTAGVVVQTTGKGASGSFKLNTAKPESKAKATTAKKVKKPVVKKTASVEKKTVAARKPASPKKAVAAKKVVESPKKTAAKKAPVKAAAKTKASVDVKAISKMKKTAKAPAAKTKTPKPKKTTSKAVKAAAKK